MQRTVNLDLPYILSNQAQKHVTHNEAISGLDALVQTGVEDTQLTAPPPAPSNGERYIVAAGGSGDWAGHDNEIAAWQDGAWAFYAPQDGWLVFDRTTRLYTTFIDGQWSQLPLPDEPANLSMLGINTTSDTTNRLAVKSDAVLFSHDDVTPGTGSMRQAINKETAPDTASIVFQTGYSGRAETGLAGDDNWRLKVSIDGAVWNEAVVANATNGSIQFPNGEIDYVTGAPVPNFLFIPNAGDNLSSVWRMDLARGPMPRTATISSISSDTITLSAAIADQFFSNYMDGVCYIAIENTSKAPRQTAWMKATPTPNQLQVTDPANLSGWINGETIQLGQTVGVFVDQFAKIDLSPMLQSQYGSVFPQSAVWFIKAQIVGAGGNQSWMNFTPNGAGGSKIGFPSFETGSIGSTQFQVPTVDLSPISNSNLLYVQESGVAGGIGIAIGTLGGVWR